MDKFLFIINPVAGSGRARATEAVIREVMEENKLDYEIIFTSREKEAIELAAKKDYDIIIAVGGDGTINEVASGLLKRGQGSLGIIPAGTGNDLSRSLNIPQDPRLALDLILKKKVKEVAIGQSNLYPFLNIASIGFDVEVLTNIHIFRKRVKGSFSYVLALIYTLLKYRKKEIGLEIDGKKIKRNLLLLAIGNGKYYGGGMKVIPHADFFDDYLHICLVKDVSNLRVLFLFPLIFRGSHTKLKKYVESYKAREIRVTSDSNLLLNVDGEVYEVGKEVLFSLSKRKIGIIF